VHALLADEGGDPQLALNRAESFRAALKPVEAAVRGRLKAAVWLVVADASRAADLRAPFLRFEDALPRQDRVGPRLLCVGTGEGDFSGARPPDPRPGNWRPFWRIRGRAGHGRR